MAITAGSTNQDSKLTEGTFRVSTAALLDSVDDPKVTPRTLEYWRHEGLLPKAERTGQAGKRPEWTYPAGALAQLAELMHLRTRTKQPDQLRSILWFRGFEIETGRAGRSIASVLRRTQMVIMKEIEKRRDPSLAPDESKWQALEKIARSMAHKRGSRSVPRLARQSQEDRERAVILLFGLTMGFDQASARIEEDAPKVERAIGIHQGRRSRQGLSAWLTGPASVGFSDFSSIASIPALIDAVETAPDEELETSRDLARVLLEGISMLSRFTDAFTLTDNAAGLAAWEAFSEDPLAAIWLTAFVVSVRRSSAYDENLNAIVDALTQGLLPAATQVQELAALSDKELGERLPHLDALPFIQQAGLVKLMAKVRNKNAPVSAADD